MTRKNKKNDYEFNRQLEKLEIDNDRRFFIACGFDEKFIDLIFPPIRQDD